MLVPNSIRTPKQGMSATSRRIAEAVDNEEWQKFRVSMKGIPTSDKLDKLREYHDGLNDNEDTSDEETVHAAIRVDNYLKALARGGQIAPVVGAGDGILGAYTVALLNNTITVIR
jgi:hypothetical protein